MSTQSLSEAFGHTGSDDEREAGSALSELCDDYLKLEAQIKAINDRLKDAKEQRDRIESTIIERMNESGMKSMKTTGGYRFTVTEKPYFSLPPQSEPEKRAEAVLWLKRVGAKELFKEQITEATMTSFLKERIDNGKPISDLLSKFVKIALSVVKGK